MLQCIFDPSPRGADGSLGTVASSGVSGPPGLLPGDLGGVSGQKAAFGPTQGNPKGDKMSSTEKKPEETTQGDHHSPVPPKTTTTTQGDHHSPAPPKSGATTQGDHHSPAPPK